MDLLSLNPSWLKRPIVVAKLEDNEIIRLKELCTHMDVIVEKLRRRPLFLYNKSLSKQLKEDEPRLISMYWYSYRDITETE